METKTVDKVVSAVTWGSVLLFMALFAARLSGFIVCSWWWVFAPVIVAFVVVLIMCIYVWVELKNMP